MRLMRSDHASDHADLACGIELLDLYLANSLTANCADILARNRLLGQPLLDLDYGRAPRHGRSLRNRRTAALSHGNEKVAKMARLPSK